MIKRAYLFFFALVLSLNTWANNYPSVPNPFRYVSDYTQTLSPNEWQTLENALQGYSQKTSSQIAVVIIPSTNGEEIAMYGANLGEKWGIGRSKLNNGVLLLVAKNDRAVNISTGRGLEAVLPDAIASSIIRNDILPYFRQELYAQGIAKGLSSIIAATQGEYEALPAAAHEEESPFEGFEIFLILAVIIFFIFAPRGSKTYISPNQAGQVIRTIEGMSRNRGSFGGGFGGGRSGGGGGFGGGSFGGGGASGRW
ncbi:methanol dehydrogenase [Pasteurellaceae bacterium RH1A]|nr:methanol dehydrogenase [Pasteurellaceae bacterium RH1A]